MPHSEDKNKGRHPRKKSPFIVSVNKGETDSFMNDIIKGASKLNTKQISTQKTNHKILFLKSILLGVAVFLTGAIIFLIAHHFIH